MKPGQENNTDMNMEPLSRLQEAETQVKAKSHVLRKKSLLLFSSSMILMIILIMAAIAWYTRVANTYAVSFDVAEYDLSANENVDHEYRLNVFNYSNVTEKKMAPGTVGWIPLKLSAYRSDVDVVYSVSVQSFIPEKIQKHMRFYYLVEIDNGKETIHYGDPVSPTRNSSDNTVSFGSYKKKYLDHLDREQENFSVITDTIAKKTQQKKLCIYWEWYWDANAAKADGAITTELTDEIRKAWDDLDTDIGRYPNKYKDSFTIYLYTSGVEAIPDLDVKTEGSEEPTGGSGGTT